MYPNAEPQNEETTSRKKIKVNGYRLLVIEANSKKG
jgi:hypothetical protein